MKDKQRKSDYIKYKKILKKYKKQLNQINKKANQSPWEYGFVLEYLITTMNFMKEYYDLGYNIWQSEESLNEIKKTLAETLDAYNAWQDFAYTLSCDIDEYNKEYKKRRNKFFKLLSENIEKWWD